MLKLLSTGFSNYFQYHWSYFGQHTVERTAIFIETFSNYLQWIMLNANKLDSPTTLNVNPNVSVPFFRFRPSTLPLVNFLLQVTALLSWRRPSSWASSPLSSCCSSWPTPCTWSSTWNTSSTTMITKLTSTTPRTLSRQSSAVWKMLRKTSFNVVLLITFNQRTHSQINVNDLRERSGEMLFFSSGLDFWNVFIVFFNKPTVLY